MPRIVPTLVWSKKFSAWRTFRIGGMKKDVLLAKIKTGYEVVSRAEELIRFPAFMTREAETTIDTIVLTPADFGAERRPTTQDLLDPGRLARWSKNNAVSLLGRTVGLLPAEAGPHFLHQYKDQPRGEILRVAMARLTDALGIARVFSLERVNNNSQWLRADVADAEYEWNLDSRFVFELCRA